MASRKPIKLIQKTIEEILILTIKIVTRDTRGLLHYSTIKQLDVGISDRRIPTHKNSFRREKCINITTRERGYGVRISIERFVGWLCKELGLKPTSIDQIPGVKIGTSITFTGEEPFASANGHDMDNLKGIAAKIRQAVEDYSNQQT